MAWKVLGFLTVVAIPLTAAHMAAFAENKPAAFHCPVGIGTTSVDVSNVITETKTPFKGSKVFKPKDGGNHLSIVLLHGSEGGSAGALDDQGKALAARGYNVMMLCYFDCDNKSKIMQTLKDVPASKVLDAVAWMRHQPGNDGKVVVYGFSRGGELTMVAGSMNAKGDRKPDALIAHTPSDQFNGPWNWAWESPRCFECKTDNCTQDSPESDYKWNGECGPDDPDKIDMKKSAFLVNGLSVPEGTRIPIEKFNGPILITVGDQDELWPVDQTHRLEATLKKAGKPATVYYFPGEKHIFTGKDELCRRAIVENFLTKFDGGNEISTAIANERAGSGAAR